MLDCMLEHEKDPKYVALGKKGGAIGGPARARALSKKRRHQIAVIAAEARWRKHREAKN